MPSLSSLFTLHYLVSGQVERVRAEACGIAQLPLRSRERAEPRSSIPIRGEANSKEMSGTPIQRMMTRPSARTRSSPGHSL